MISDDNGNLFFVGFAKKLQKIYKNRVAHYIKNHYDERKCGGVDMRYKAVVLKYNPRAVKMAEEAERVANEYAEKGWKLVTFSVTPSAKGILVFEVSEEKQ